MQKYSSARPAQRAIQKAWAAFDAGNYTGAIEAADLASRLGGDVPEIAYLKCSAMSRLGQDEAAMSLALATQARYPNNPSLAGLVGLLEHKKWNFTAAVPLLKRGLEGMPRSAVLWQAYTGALVGLEDHHAARVACEQALKILPNDENITINYASALRSCGDIETALTYYRRGQVLAPDNKINGSNMLLALLSDPDADAATLRKEAEKFAAVLARTAESPGPSAAPVGNDAPRVRLGILSADFRRHACVYFLIPLIANIDRNAFEVVLFSLNPKPDTFTDQIRQYADTFIDVADRPEPEVVRTLRDAQVDVMIDLGGYTGISPLSFMVHRLAPTQITWLGYPGTTGMKEIDYRITDWASDPDGFDDHYTEKLLRAPIFCAYHAQVTHPLLAYEPAYRVQQAPALTNGYITFGSCNSIGKLTASSFRLWSAVLARCPGSKLLIEAAGLGVTETRERMEGRLRAHGIDTDRVIFVPREGKNQYLTYHRIDIALDTSPYTGGTTTCDALWMGVPVVTLAGNAFHQRISVPFLNAVELDALVCEDEASYVDTACALASDVMQLDALRQSLRQRTERSRMSDAQGFAAWFEETVYHLVSERKGLPAKPPAREEGIFFGGKWYATKDLVLSLAAHLHTGDHESVRNILGNLSSTWYRHWIVCYGLAVVKYREGFPDEAIDLLVEAIGQRPYSLPLYRQLAAWLDECALDKTALAGLLGEQFGLTLEALEASPVATSFEIFGIEVEHVADEDNALEALA
ncbi:O-linked N-acetylglucosamine transferase, SPINDLY family protein [Cupriavidus plantarum]|uniref:protein O-GlcNAc transferase n=1 Tax=Cupriavidus plantarum TaxID=942865 RepID=A0A316EVE2_9BURK|nr:hypothetical protein [Cupriavidus plantarum]PWK35565.1 putative O-linked N-acetylglucosamine transferase (SPINDLY family) [Cupriavidus plantarum]